MAEKPSWMILGHPVELSANDAQALAAQVSRLVAGDLAIESVQAPRDQRREGVLVIRGRLLRPSEEAFPRWLAALHDLGYTPLLRPDPQDGAGQVSLHVMAGVAPPARPRVWINGVLFVLTVLSTLFVGSLYGEAPANVDSVADLLLPQNLMRGWPFAVTLLSILAAHEFGHYFAARYHRVAVTLPYFIPMPFGFGTLGAFIQLKAPVSDRRKLFDIGVAGPLAGVVLAIPLLLLGLSTSPVKVPEPMPGAVLEGNSILYYFAKIAVFGKVLPNAVTGEDVFMNQVTFAAWIGLLVTALNLLPVGQLDGGHTVFAMFGEKARHVNRIAIIVMGVLALASFAPVQAVVPVLANVGFSGWFVWLVLIFALIGPYHPPALDDVTELDARRRLIGYLVILLFILTFVPVPLRPL